MPTERTQTELRSHRVYLREFVPAVVGYVVTLLAIVFLIDDWEAAGAWKYPVALLPVLPALWGARAIGRNLRRIDEFQRDLQLNGMAVGFAAAMIAAVTIGFLAMAGLDSSRWGPWLIYSAGMLAWLLATVRKALAQE